MKLTVSYKQADVGEGYDAIVIGSGIGSLVSAAALARAGKKCLILERHYTAGGYTHVFKRRNYEWDVGIHYIGEVMRENSMLSCLFRYISDGSIKWADMGEVYDRIRFGDDIYPFVRGREAFADQLKTDFPDVADGKAIDEYILTVRSAAREARGFFMEKALPSIAAKVAGGRMRSGFLKYASKTTLEVLQGITSNKKLIAVLTGQYGDYGLPPSQSSFAMHAMVVRHYLGGGAYPVGGSASIFEGIAPIIIGAGGLIATNAEVQQVVTQKGKAVGVDMADGRRLMAPVIISGAGVATTSNRLLSQTDAKKTGLQDCLTRVDSSAAHLCAYLGFEESTAELGLQPANWWYYPPVYDHDALIDGFFQDPSAEFPVIYASFPSAKDPTWSERFPGRSTVEIITVAPYDWFTKWENTKWHKRGAEYEDLKGRLTERMLSKLYELEPQLRGKADHVELSTPLSTRHFCNYEKGEIYGLQHDPGRFDQRLLRPRTSIKGFYLTGQDVATAGVGGAMMGGLLCAASILKKNLVKEVMTS